MNRRSPDPLDGLLTPPAPAELKRRVLLAAQLARVERCERRLEERLWRSSGLRLAWLATVAALLIVNLLIPPSATSPPAASPGPGKHLSALAANDLDELPSSGRPAGDDRAAVLCELAVDCPGEASSPSEKGDRA